jgi:DNA polymerase elongation subunit (family B)
MPAVEIADSIVQSGRETLEKVCVWDLRVATAIQPNSRRIGQAIQYIDSNEKWGARVVYGDTDSLFVYLKGKTKEQAFRIGYDIADAITRLNPVPVKLKFEKVRQFVFQTLLAFGMLTCLHLGLPALCFDGEEAICWLQIRKPRRCRACIRCQRD